MTQTKMIYIKSLVGKSTVEKLYEKVNEMTALSRTAGIEPALKKRILKIHENMLADLLSIGFARS